jgi:hypothetical protein
MMSDFGIDPNRVYSNDSLVGNTAFWSVLPGGTDGKIVTALRADNAVKVAINAKLNAPNDPNAREHVVDVINRATASCLGQAILKRELNPDDQTCSLYHVLKGGTAGAIDQVINAPANNALHDAFGKKDVNAIIHVITRETGRGLFEACVSQLIKTVEDPSAVVEKVVGIVSGDLKKVIGL